MGIITTVLILEHQKPLFFAKSYKKFSTEEVNVVRREGVKKLWDEISWVENVDISRGPSSQSILVELQDSSLQIGSGWLFSEQWFGKFGSKKFVTLWMFFAECCT